MRNLSDFEPFVTLYTPDAPPVVIQHAVREAARHFMAASRLFWEFAHIGTQSGMGDYHIPARPEHHVLRVDGVFVPPSTAADGTLPDFRWHQLPICEYEIDRTDGPVIIRLRHHPSVDGRLVVKYQWTIERDAVGVPDSLYEDYQPAITAKALSLLYAQVGQSWYAAQESVRQERVYDEHLSSASVRRRPRSGTVTFGRFL